MPAPESLANIPNLLSFARIPLAVVLFVCVVQRWWLAGLLLFLVAAFTDWLDGWWARRFGPLTLVGRNLDTVTDKVLVCGTFVYLAPVPEAGIPTWAAVLVLSRELIVTAVRGVIEATGQKFGADWFGKLKMGFQCAVLIGVFLIQWWRTEGFSADVLALLEPVQLVLFWLMVAATVGSGVQYLVKGHRMLHTAPDRTG
ncbi:CDP-diacylglycerol--glycerol-3-phosphate 3-phosphatidyltransferase [Urbifossiella limnaea]|uniref:CDP-diacylglycerol--glycerol-3-phosphate 3-phosphatidyltransferase n=2 Tax=Urbifossiella limnaea TaxID=2528023 RepID=A0A517XPD3_9BACT|nr:CDP-diacylglycerol--glycerol-3-phosphate 3-phosphatidyltransferase [Urbifossiella limnaea]